MSRYRFEMVLTPNERATYLRAATVRGMSLAGWVRDACRNWSLRERINSLEEERMRLQLNREKAKLLVDSAPGDGVTNKQTSPL